MMSFEYWYFLNSDKRKISISILYIPVNVCPCFVHYAQEKFWVDVYVIFVAILYQSSSEGEADPDGTLPQGSPVSPPRSQPSLSQAPMDRLSWWLRYRCVKKIILNQGKKECMIELCRHCKIAKSKKSRMFYCMINLRYSYLSLLILSYNNEMRFKMVKGLRNITLIDTISIIQDVHY